MDSKKADLKEVCFSLHPMEFSVCLCFDGNGDKLLLVDVCIDVCCSIFD